MTAFYRKECCLLLFLLLPALTVQAEESQTGPLTTEETSLITDKSIDDIVDVSEDDQDEDEVGDYGYDDGQADDMPESAEPGFFSILDAPQRSISKSIKSIAAGVDGFFADENIYYQTNESFIQLTADAVWEEEGEVGYSGDVRIKLRLPVTQKKLKLIIESDPDEKRDELDTALEDTPVDAADKKEYYAGVQATLGRPAEWSFRPSIGVKIRSPLDYFVRYRASRTYNMDDWELRLNETLYWFDSSGAGFDSALDLDHPLDKDLLFRSSSFARYTEETEYFSMSQVFSLFHTLSERRAVSYQAGVYCQSEPAIFANNYLLSIKYRQNIHSDYLFAEVIPQILYRKDNDFHAEHSVTFRLEMVFGG